jgi:hypothetical protein
VVVDSRRTPTPSRILGGAPEEDKEEETGWRNISMAIEEDEEEETGRRSTSMATASLSTTTGSRGTRRRRRRIEVELGLEWIPAGRRHPSLGTAPPPSELGNRPAAIRICTRVPSPARRIEPMTPHRCRSRGPAPASLADVDRESSPSPPPSDRSGGAQGVGEGSAVERGGGRGWIERTTVGMRERREIPEDEGEKG